MSQNECGSNDSAFVKAEPSLNMDFVLKVGIPDGGGSKKYHRLRLETLVDLSTRKLDIGHLRDYFQTRSPASTNPEFSYRDVDGDLCVITTTADLLEAVQQSQKGYLKLETSSLNNDETNNIKNTAASETPSDDDHPVLSGNSNNYGQTTEASSSYKNRVQRAIKRPEQNEETSQQETDNMEEVHPDVLRAHLLDRFQDHYNLDHPKDFFPGDDFGDAWSVMTQYQLGGKLVKSPYFAMDDVYLDLTMDPWPDGEPFVRMAIPSKMLMRIADQLAGLSSTPPPESALDPVVVAYDPESVEFVTMREEDLVRTRHGPLMDVIENGQHRHFFKASGVFTVEATKEPISLAVTLVEVVVFSAQDEVLEALYGANSGAPDDEDFDDRDMRAPHDEYAAGWIMNYTDYSDEEFF